MNPLQHSSKKLPCPVCNGTNAACKSRENFVLCMAEADSAKFEIVNGWKNIGISKDWAQFVPADQKGRDPIDAKKQSEAKAKREALYKSGLNAAERHTNNTALLAQLSLNDDDLADLLDRGVFCESLDLFRSIEPGQTLSEPVDERTPGVGFGGRKLLNRWGGYLVPARDLNGNITAFQIRNRNGGNDAPKYPWLSVADVSPANLSDGEMPLTFTRGGNGSKLYLNEGILKPIVASNRLGINVIGASGGLFASSPNQLREWIEQLNPSELILCPDGGDIANPKVMARIERQFEFFAELGLSVRVLWWGQATKADGDIDEISVEQFEKASLISWAEFAAKDTSQRISAPLTPAKLAKPAPKRKSSKTSKAAAKYTKKQQQELTQLLSVAKEVAPEFKLSGDSERDAQRAKQVIYAATTKRVEYDRTIINTGSKFDEDTLDSLMRFTGPVFVGGETGGGKTELATQLAAYAQESDAGMSYSAIAPTQVLSVQVAQRFEQKGLPMESTAIFDKTKNEGNSRKPKAIPAESLWKLNGKKFDFLAADEPDQWVPRVLSGILGDAADVNLRVLRDLARKTPHQFWLNADPSPITADLIGDLAGQQPILIDLQRHQDKKPVSVDWYSDGVSESGTPILGSNLLYQNFVNDARRGKRVMLLAASVKKARAVRNRLRKQGIKALLKNGKYTPKAQRLGFALKPEEAMEDHKVVILTRLVETGLDLQKDFDSVYVALSPKMEARSAHQFLSRSRSLLRGDTGKLCIYSPTNTQTSIEQLSVSHWEQRLKRDNKLYTKLLRGDTSKAEQKLEALDWAIGYQARYKADAARQTYLRDDLLRSKFADLGWKIDNELAPGVYQPIADDLKTEILRAQWTEAHCTARGKRRITDYSEEYAGKIADPNEQGLILECKRRKLELSSLLPSSDLEDVDLIFKLQENERLLPQTLLWSAIELNPHSERMQKLIKFLSSTHLEKFETYGAMEGLKKLRSSKSMLAFGLAEILAGDPLVERVIAGDDAIHKHQSDVQQFAQKLQDNSELINLWCRRHFGRDFAWDEDCVSVVCKALDKLLGIKSGSVGQSTVEAQGNRKRARLYRTAFSPEGQEAIAKNDSEYKQNPELAIDKVMVEFCERYGLMESAQRGWLNQIDEAVSYIQQHSEALHTKTQTLDSIDLDFSVQLDTAFSPPESSAPPAEPILMPLDEASSPQKASKVPQTSLL